MTKIFFKIHLINSFINIIFNIVFIAKILFCSSSQVYILIKIFYPAKSIPILNRNIWYVQYSKDANQIYSCLKNWSFAQCLSDLLIMILFTYCSYYYEYSYKSILIVLFNLLYFNYIKQCIYSEICYLLVTQYQIGIILFYMFIDDNEI